MIKLLGVNCPAKTRIKKITQADGGVRYIPQHRCWGEWYNFSDWGGLSILRSKEPLITIRYTEVEGDSTDIFWAMSIIDEYIKSFEPSSKRVVETEYIKYP